MCIHTIHMSPAEEIYISVARQPSFKGLRQADGILPSVKCTLSVQQCALLIKGHIKSLDDQVYQIDDYVVVIKHYWQFLSGCAQYTRRLNSSVVQPAVISILGVSPTIGRKFGDSMASALKYCFDKGELCNVGKATVAQCKKRDSQFQRCGFRCGSFAIYIRRH